MNRYVVGVVVLVMVLVGVGLGVRHARRPVAPLISVAGHEGQATVPVAYGAPVDLRVGVTEPRYLYVFDRVGTEAPVLIWRSGPSDPPFEPGEYAADGEFGRRPGLHEVFAVASAAPQAHPEQWKTVDELKTCAGCGTASVTVLVAAPADGGGLYHGEAP
ncbi:MAG: hypothetical protein JNM69_31065 [Archangium sp.]|nr:hypothetical protein [Archangium sp.]